MRCKTCGQEFTSYIHEGVYRWCGPKFCSPSCEKEWQAEYAEHLRDVYQDTKAEREIGGDE